MTFYLIKEDFWKKVLKRIKKGLRTWIFGGKILSLWIKIENKTL